MDRHETYNTYCSTLEKKIDRAKSNIIGLKCDMYVDMLEDESGEAWDGIIELLSDAEDALAKAIKELNRIREA